MSRTVGTHARNNSSEHHLYGGLSSAFGSGTAGGAVSVTNENVHVRWTEFQIDPVSNIPISLLHIKGLHFSCLARPAFDMQDVLCINQHRQHYLHCCH